MSSSWSCLSLRYHTVMPCAIHSPRWPSQATWLHVREALGRMGIGCEAPPATHVPVSAAAGSQHQRQQQQQRCITLADVRLMAALCPEVAGVYQHHRAAPPPLRDAWRLGASPGKVRAALRVVAEAEAEAAAGRQALANPLHLATTDGAGTVLAAAVEDTLLPALMQQGQVAAAGGGQQRRQATEGAGARGEEQECDTLVLEFVDPGAGQLAVPPAFVRAMRGREDEVAAALQDGSGGSGGRAAAGKAMEQREQRLGRDAARAGPGARQPPARVNKAIRQQWYFRRAAMRAMLHLYRRHCEPEASRPAAASDPGPYDGSKGQQEQPGQRQQPQRSSRRAAPTAAAAPAGAAASVQQLIALKAWPASFNLAAIDEAQLRAAADELSAGAWAAAAAARAEAAEADALAAARRLAAEDAGSGAASGTSKAAGAPALPAQLARPPQLLKKHPPCTDTTALGTEAFLAHLRSLPWYCGQVAHVERRPGREPQYCAPAAALAPPVAAALAARGVGRLFSHQAEAVDLLTQASDQGH